MHLDVHRPVPHDWGFIAFRFSFSFVSIVHTCRTLLLRRPASFPSIHHTETVAARQSCFSLYFCMGFKLSGKGCYHLFAILWSFRYMHMDFAFCFGHSAFLISSLLPYSHLVLTVYYHNFFLSEYDGPSGYIVGRLDGGVVRSS